MECEETEKAAVIGCYACLCDPACGYVLALAGVVLQSVSQMVGVCLSAAPRLYTVETGVTHGNVKLMPRLLLPFNQNQEIKSSYFPVCLSLCLSLCLSTALSA